MNNDSNINVVKCRLCDKHSVELLIDFGMQPIVHNLTENINKNEKLYSFKLGSCTNCGFLQLIDFIPADILYQDYFTLSSWKNQPHTDRFIEVSKSIAGINKKSKIFEIGCNDGTFLLKLKDLNYINISGVEPTKDAYKKTKEHNLNVDNDFFSKEYVLKNNISNTFDVVISRHVLEHIPDLDGFMSSAYDILSEKGKLIIEVPDGECNLINLDYTLWEEHVNYFTFSTLSQLAIKHNFRVIHHETTLFSGKSLAIFCEKNTINANNIVFKNENENAIRLYQKYWHTLKKEWHTFLSQQKNKIAIYGCGCRSSTFVNFLEIGKYIECFIDDQPEKQGLILPLSNVKIKAWDNKYIDYIFLLGVNTENEHSIIQKRELDISKVYSILPPSALIPNFWKNIIEKASII